jgi:hypothetical protein
MTINALHQVARLFVLTGIIAAGVSVVSETLSAQVTCYRTRCLVYPDGLRICERTPVDCATIQWQ